MPSRLPDVREILMTRRQFEDAMRVQFGSADYQQWQSLLIRERWDQLPPSKYVDHLVGCSDCVQRLLQFLRTRNVIDHSSAHCFHVAYYPAEVSERCLDESFGIYSPFTNRFSDRSVRTSSGKPSGARSLARPRGASAWARQSTPPATTWSARRPRSCLQPPFTGAPLQPARAFAPE